MTGKACCGCWVAAGADPKTGKAGVGCVCCWAAAVPNIGKAGGRRPRGCLSGGAFGLGGTEIDVLPLFLLRLFRLAVAVSGYPYWE